MPSIHCVQAKQGHRSFALIALLLSIAVTLAIPQTAQAAVLHTMRLASPQQVAAATAEAETSEVDEDKVAAVEKLLRAGVAGHQEGIDVSSVGASEDEVKVACSDIIYDPAIYTLFTGYSFSYADTVDTIYLNYAVDAADLASWEEKAEAKVAEALTWVNDSMSDAQKAQALHDYLVRNCAYDQDVSSNDKVPFTALGALVDGSAVCQGYSDAYSLLLSRAGIDSEYVPSKSMAHGWNMVQVDGGWYHVDVTWDDPTVNGSDQGFDADVSHEFFLKSDDTFTSLDHSGWTAKHTAPADYEMEYAVYDGPVPQSDDPTPDDPTPEDPAPIDITNAIVRVDSGDLAYTGDALTPDVSVTLDGAALASGTDYEVSYSDNIDAGIASVTVVGAGNYTGTATSAFEILPADLSEATVVVADQQWNGEPLEPEVDVDLEGSALVKDTDYEVSYSDNVDAGTATVTATGRGNYTGTAIGTFAITKPDGLYEEDGATWYYVGGERSDVTDVLKVGSTWYSVVKGKVTPGPTVAKNSKGWWYIDESGEVDFSFTGVASNANGTWWLEKGKVNFSKSGIATASGESWYVKAGRVQTGTTDVLKVGSTWYNVVKGKVTAGPTVAKNSKGWWYIDSTGKVDFGYTGVASNSNGTWYLKAGKVRFDVTDVLKVGSAWYNVVKGKVTAGPAIAKNSNGTWYIGQNGQVDFSKTDVVKVGSTWYNVVKGKVTAGPTVAKNSKGWWYINSQGRVDFSYTGVAKNSNGTWWIEGGEVNFSKTGVVTSGGTTWYVESGKVQTGYTGSYVDSSGTTWDVRSGKAQEVVYYTPNGERYHSTVDCPSLGRSKVINSCSLSQAQGRGLTACKNCYH